ncbi:hypothetical protein ACWD4T_38725, partial [Streptomyces umbrinus]
MTPGEIGGQLGVGLVQEHNPRRVDRARCAMSLSFKVNAVDLGVGSGRFGSDDLQCFGGALTWLGWSW